jgi:hypothetical protein
VRRNTSIPILLMPVLLATLLSDARAQAPAPGQPDPLMSLMLSQPSVDTTSPVQATASFDPPTIHPGDLCTYRVTFNALLDSIQWPEEMVAPPQLGLKARARGQIVQTLGTNLQPRTTFNYRADVSSPGMYTVPKFMVYVYNRPVTVPVAQLQVVPATTAAAPPAQELILDVPATNLFPGQPVNVRVLLPGSNKGIVQFLTQVELKGEGFLADSSRVQQKVEVMPHDGRDVATFVYETAITPITSGRIALTAQAFTAGNSVVGDVVITGPATIPAGPPQYTLLDSDPVSLNVRPLPREGELPGFMGAIGSLTLDPPKLATNVVRVGDPAKLTVTIRGTGNLARLLPPPPPRVRDWQVFDANKDATPPQVVQGRGFVTFTYTLIPANEETRATPAIPFSYFDPNRSTYVDLTIPPVPVTVKSGAQPADLLVSPPPENRTPSGEKEPSLSGFVTTRGKASGSLVPLQQRPWFPLVQLGPALLFIGLWTWDRRRRYLEQHPDIVLRARARRALRREWRALREAGSSGNGPRFATCAVSAMRAACAPHYPAEPRALVGADILRLLKPGQRQAGPGVVVRQIFAVADAARFDTGPADTGELLALQPELEGVLAELEAML